MRPEERARQEIDQQLEQCGWQVQDHAQMNISAALGVAVREFPLGSAGYADYLLYADGKIIAVVEAKPEGYTLTGVEIQSEKYSQGLPDIYPAYRRPIPFAYESTGKVTQFTNGLDPQPRSREVFTFHRPEELIRLATQDAQLREKLRALPPIDGQKLWPVQREAIENLEESLAQNRPRALIQMATGSGKTFTACSFVYRLIKHAKAKRVLFLVDRNNLGRQTLKEFQQFDNPGSQYKFTEEYNVQRLTRNTIDPASKVCITTIQRMYSILKGEEELESETEEDSLFEQASPLIKEPLPVVYNPQVPIESFDFIVIDECHRSIYNVWRQVLEYFDAFLIGLTATPTAQTVGFFEGNVVQNYSHEKAVVDNVNVGYSVYRIDTKVTQDGGSVVREEGVYVPHRDRRTKEVVARELEEDIEYEASKLDRDVVNPSQIRTVIQTFRDRLFTEIFPGRKEVPKTLIFAKTDLHADDIVKVVREEFGKGNDFCQKITSKTTGKKPEDLLNEFRNSYNPRVAVTVDMIATGTDVKPLECLVFMRNINSAAYFEQMKGRGCRVIREDDLRQVTADAGPKTRFVIVDAVGVCENDKSISKPLDRQPSVSFEKVMSAAASGQVHEDLVSTLGARLARLNGQMTPEQEELVSKAAGGTSLRQLVSDLFTSLDPDVNAQKVRDAEGLAADAEVSEEQIAEAEKERMGEALKPFHDPKLRDTLLGMKRQLEQVIDEINQDELLQAGFDEQAREQAQTLISDFRAFLEEHKDEIEALRIIYSRPYRAGLRYEHVKELKEALKQPPLSLVAPERELWRVYEALEPDKVKGKGGSHLVDLVAIVRHALNPEAPLVPVAEEVERRYAEWLDGKEFSEEQMKWLDAIKDHIASSLAIEVDDFEDPPLSQMGGIGKAYEVFGDQFNDVLQEMNGRLVA